MENYYVERRSMGPRDLRRNERVNRQSDACAAKENNSYRIVHYHYGNSARGIGVRTKPAQTHDLRLEELSLLLSTHAGSANAVWRARGVLSRERSEGASKRGHSSARDDRWFFPTAPR